MSQISFIHGFHAIIAKLRHQPDAILEVFIDAERHDARVRDLMRHAELHAVKVVPVDAKRLEGMAGGGTRHQGVVAKVSGQTRHITLDDVLDTLEEPAFLLVLDGIQDPHNLGAVMRSALLCGAHGIVIPKRGGASVTPTVIKSSAGAAERLPVARVANIGETIRRLKEQGVFVYCADMDGVPLRKNNLTGPIALVLGSEGSGVSQLVKKLCDGVVRLDMAAQGTGVDSYNVSVAAGIILYEIQSQRAVEE